MSYDIIATLGPASHTPAIWQAMYQAGSTAFRLNTSHLTLNQLHDWLNQLEPFLAACQPRPPLVLDLQGSKWRIGQIKPNNLATGQTIQLILGDSATRSDQLPVPHADFFQAAAQAAVGDEVILNDAKIKLTIGSTTATTITAIVKLGGEISAHKGITYARSDYRRETLSDKDRVIVEQTRQLPNVRYAMSYVKDVIEMAQYRALIGNAYLIAKLERQPAMNECTAIAASADELWVCRGDLGAELGLRGMAEAVHQITTQVRDLPIPVIIAGQVLEHMTDHATPTRAEVCQLFDALAAGYRGCVLSDEAAIGRYPIESVRIAAMFRN
jgi:pyruvate kinase